MADVRFTTCNRDCPDACRIAAHVEDGRVVKLGGDPGHPVTRGFLCARTHGFLERQYREDRVTRPLVRRGGELVPTTWEEALDEIAARLLAIRAESGPAAVFHYKSGGSLGKLKKLCTGFWEAFGPVTEKRGDICAGAGLTAQAEDFGEATANDLEDLVNARTILLWGKNPTCSSPHTLPLLREARARGAHVVLIDPVRHQTVGHGDRYWQVRPGHDAHLALALARALLDEPGARPAEAPSAWCDDVDAYEALVASRTVAAWCADTDVDEGEVRALAHRFALGPVTCLLGWGLGRRRHGAASVHAIDALFAWSGHVGAPGTGVGFAWSSHDVFRTPALVGGRTARTIPEPLFGPAVLEARDPPIRAVWVTAGNPVAMLPDSAKVAAALEQTELVVVCDSFLTDTARRATFVLPTTTLLEDDDLLASYGHHWLGTSRPVVAPPPGVKTDLEILQALAPRLGLAGLLDGDARAWKERFLEGSGVTVDELDRGPVRNPRAPAVAFAGRRFPTSTGRARLWTTPPAPPRPDDDVATWPLQLLSVSTPRTQSSQENRPAGAGPAVVTVHPGAAAGALDGELVDLVSPLGRLVVRVQLDDTQRPDVVLLPKGGGLDDGRAANLLIAARLTDEGEGGALYDQRVRLERRR